MCPDCTHDPEDHHTSPLIGCQARNCPCSETITSITNPDDGETP